MPRGFRTNRIRIEHRQYPNGQWFYNVMFGETRVGTFEHRDSGYVIFGCRTGYATAEEAAKETAWRCVRRMLKETALLSRALDEPVSPDAVDPSAGVQERGPRATPSDSLDKTSTT